MTKTSKQNPASEHETRTDKQDSQVALSAKQQFTQAKLAHANGTVCIEDYIWTAMQCYAAELRASQKA